MIMLSSDHNTKWLKSFSVPSLGFRHILSRLPPRQGSLPKNKRIRGNNFLREHASDAQTRLAPLKHQVFENKNRPAKIFEIILPKKKFPASKNEMLQIIRNTSFLKTKFEYQIFWKKSSKTFFRCRKMKRWESSETRFGQVSRRSEPSSRGKRPFEVCTFQRTPPKVRYPFFLTPPKVRYLPRKFGTPPNY